MPDRATAEVWGLRARNTIARLAQLVGFLLILLGAFVLFYPAATELGVPLAALPAGQLMTIYDGLGVHWLVLMVAGAVTVWLTTRA